MGVLVSTSSPFWTIVSRDKSNPSNVRRMASPAHTFARRRDDRALVGLGLFVSVARRRIIPGL